MVFQISACIDGSLLNYKLDEVWLDVFIAIHFITWLSVIASINIEGFDLGSSNIKRQMIAEMLFWLHITFRLWILGLSLECMQPCHGLDLHNQNPKLTEVPVGLPTDLSKLDLRSNEISEIGADNFAGLSAVADLDLSYNRIAYIDDHAFLPCVALSWLNLGNNMLTSMPVTLGQNSPNILFLSVRENPCVIEESWLRAFRSLQTFEIDNIGMSEFPNDFFMGLISLKLLQISKTNAPNLTERTVSLEDLRFNDHIGSAYPDENFFNLKNLTTVSMLFGDHMTTVPRFLGATALTTIKLFFTVGSLPDLSHLTSLSTFVFNPSKMICDYRLCWTLFESYTFSLGFFEIMGCFFPEKFRSRNIYSFSKLELGCYDSKFIIQGALQLPPLINHLPLDKMTAISQTIFSDAFLWIKSFVF